MYSDIINKIESAVDVMVSLIKQHYVFSCGVSGGKDSTVALIITLEAIRRVACEGHPQGEHYVISANTTIETRISLLGSDYPWKFLMNGHRAMI